MDLKQVGKRLRGKREEMNLSLKEVENATSIKTVYLQAIEEGRVEHILSNVYALGFIKQYGSFLGFEVNKEFGEALRLPAEKQEFAYGIGTLEMRGNPHGGMRWKASAMWVMGTIGLVITAWYFAKFVGVF